MDKICDDFDDMQNQVMSAEADDFPAPIFPICSAKFVNMSDDKFTFQLSYNDGVFTLKEYMTLERVGGGWATNISLEDFPPKNNPTDAAHELADWLEKLAVVIKSNDNFSKINLEDL